MLTLFGPIELFYNLRTDLDKLRYATHITKIISDVTVENENSEEILQLFLNTLHMLANTDQNMNFIISVFKLRLISRLGYTPHIKKCSVCGDLQKEDTLTYFSLKENGFKCDECGSGDKSAIKISSSTKDAIRYIILSPVKKIFAFHIPEDSMKELELIAKIYLNEKLEKEYKLENLF